jgi:hypothetical protein
MHIFVLITNNALAIAGARFDNVTKSSVPMKNPGGQQIGTLDSMPTDLPAG